MALIQSAEVAPSMLSVRLSVLILSRGVSWDGLKNNVFYGGERNSKLNNIPKKIKRMLRKIKMVVIRLGGNGNFTMSKPCRHCIKYLKLMGVKAITYSTNSGFICEKLSRISSVHVCQVRRRFNWV